jgi:hypothetical protein
MRWRILRCDVEQRSKEPIFSGDGKVGYTGAAPAIIKLELTGDDDFMQWIWAASQRGEITGGAFPSPRRDEITIPVQVATMQDMPSMQDAIDELSGRKRERTLANDLRKAAKAALTEPRRAAQPTKPAPAPAPKPAPADGAARLAALDFGDKE